MRKLPALVGSNPVMFIRHSQMTMQCELTDMKWVKEVVILSDPR